MKIYLLAITFCILNTVKVSSQVNISSKDFTSFTTYFSLTDEHNIDYKGQEVFLKAIGDNQFVGLAEMPQYQQLSYFTIGFLELIKQKGFNHFALEIGPCSATVLQAISADPKMTSERLKTLNHTYGKNFFPKIPLIFVDKVEDAMFVEKASSLGFEFWGLDQEF